MADVVRSKGALAALGSGTLSAAARSRRTYVVDKVAQAARVVGGELGVVARHDFVHEAFHVAGLKGVLLGGWEGGGEGENKVKRGQSDTAAARRRGPRGGVGHGAAWRAAVRRSDGQGPTRTRRDIIS